MGLVGQVIDRVGASQQRVEASGDDDTCDEENYLDERPPRHGRGLREGRVGQERVGEGLRPAAASPRVAAHRLDLRGGQGDQGQDHDRQARADPRQGGELASSLARERGAGEEPDRHQEGRGQESEEGECGARVRADEAQAAQEEEEPLGDATGKRSGAAPVAQIRG